MDLHLDEKCTNGVWFTYGFYNGAEPGRIRWRSKKIFKNLKEGLVKIFKPRSANNVQMGYGLGMDFVMEPTPATFWNLV